MKYYIIGDEDSVLGFGMVGVQGSVARDTSEAQRVFKKVLTDKEIGIIIITERVADLIRLEVDHYVFTESFPLIVEIPDRNGKLEGKLSIRDMVNKAIGINL